MRLRMKNNHAIEYSGVQPHYDSMGPWKWSVDHTDGAFAGTRVMFSSAVWEVVPEDERVMLIDRKGFEKVVTVKCGTPSITIPYRAGNGFGQIVFERTSERVNGNVVYREAKDFATGGILSGLH